MDGFKNSTKMKYMCGGPVRKATGGMAKSAAPKSVAKSASSAKQLPTPEIASKRQVQPTPPKDVVRKAPRPTMEPKRLIAQTPPEDAKTIGGAPKAPKDAGRELPRPMMEPKRPVNRPAPEDVKTMGGAPKGAKTMGALGLAAKTASGAPAKATATPRGMSGAPAKATAAPRGMSGAPAKATAAPRGMSGAPAKATATPRGMEAAKTMGSVGMAKKGVPSYSNKPMIGFKTGGHVTKSMTKW